MRALHVKHCKVRFFISLSFDSMIVAVIPHVWDLNPVNLASLGGVVSGVAILLVSFENLFFLTRQFTLDVTLLA